MNFNCVSSKHLHNKMCRRGRAWQIGQSHWLHLLFVCLFSTVCFFKTLVALVVVIVCIFSTVCFLKALVALVVVIVCLFSTVRFLKTSAQDDDDVLLCIWAERDKLVSQWLGRLFLNCCEASHKRLSPLSSTSDYEMYLLRRTLYLSELLLIKLLEWRKMFEM